MYKVTEQHVTETANALFNKWKNTFLISNIYHVLNVVCFLLGNSPASEFYMLTFQNTLFHLHRQVGVGFLHLPAYEDGTDSVFQNIGT